MNRLFTPHLFLIFLCSFIGATNIYAQASSIPSDWTKITACKITFLIPKDLKNENAEGVDSCIAAFSNNKMRLSIDYGWYGGAYSKYDTLQKKKTEKRHNGTLTRQSKGGKAVCIFRIPSSLEHGWAYTQERQHNTMLKTCLLVKNILPLESTGES